MSEKNLKQQDILKFVIVSLVGIFLFMIPIRNAEGTYNIPLGHVITWLNSIFARISFGEYALGNLSFHYLLAFLAIFISFIFTILAYTLKPKFILENDFLKEIFLTSPVYIISRFIAFVIVIMIFTGRGPDFIINAFTGDVMIGLTAGLMTVFLILGPAMPIITDFGLMEFTGVLIKKVVRKLFTLPGRSSIDLMAAWFGSSAVSIIITKLQHEKGFYTGREAAVIAVNFSFVSLPFTFVIANTLGLSAHFGLFYLIMCITCIILAFIMPRIWPLSKLKDDYLENVGKQIDEDVPKNTSPFSHALVLASNRASKTSFSYVIEQGLKNYVNIFMDLIPIILAWGTLAIILVEFTPVFDIISFPMGWFLNILGVEGAFEFAPSTIVGFIDMYIPAVLLSSAPIRTQFIIGILSIVQIIYLAETGALILKSKIPLNIIQLFIVFLLRTIIGLPIIVLLTNLFFR
ncbi:MAG: YjiH family protein [Defluviitaleaceae bacterium]|nr:YjiH family protein [Defluviitaleaceae bacterium]